MNYFTFLIEEYVPPPLFLPLSPLFLPSSPLFPPPSPYSFPDTPPMLSTSASNGTSNGTHGAEPYVLNGFCIMYYALYKYGGPVV